MVSIPPEDAAREAWAALAPKVRAEVIRLAASGEGHPDVAVAALAVGRARAERWPWWRTATLGVGLCLCGGGALALVAVGSSLFDLPMPGWSALAFPTLVGYSLVDKAQRMRLKGGLPEEMETANLRSFLASPDAEPSPPSPRRGLTSRRIAVGVAVAAGILGVAVSSTEVAGLPGGLLGGLRRNGLGIILCVVLLAALIVYQPRRLPIRVAATADGLRLNWLRKPIPWSDVTSAAVGAMEVVWSLRDGSTFKTSLSAHGRLPEDTILAARSYMVAARQAA